MGAQSLDGARLLETACERTGLDDLGGTEFRVGLDVLFDGLRNEARLSELGVLAAPEVLMSYVTNRLGLVDWHTRHPEIGQVELSPVVFMIGMGRTGTTIVHDLLAQDPANRVARTWEVDRPFPPPETATYDTDPRIADVQAGIDAAGVARPELQAMHPMGAQLAQECVRIMGSEFASLIFLSQFRAPTYLHWLTHEADMASTYALHRRFLQLLQWRHRADRWVLKSGAHLWAIPAMLAEYPDARFIQTHRDPMKVIASLSSLFTYIRATFSDEVHLPETAQEWAEPILDALDRSVTAREDGSIPPDRVVDVAFDAFMADPIAQLRRIYDFLDVELTPQVEQRMRGFLDANAVDKHGRHSYSFADTGLDEGELRERARRYTDYFGVTPEPLR